MIIYKNNEKYIHFDYEYEEYTYDNSKENLCLIKSLV